jgi:hypothetical protein
LRYAAIAVICLLALAAGTATAIASTVPSSQRSGDAAASAVRALRHEIRSTRHLALWTAYVAALPEPRHGHAERSATTVPALVPILLRWQHRLTYYRAALARRQPVLDGLRCIHQYEGPWNAVSDSSPTYYGGLQMDRAFERAYGDDVLSAHAGADADTWSAHDQLMVAMRAYRQAGYSPWPNTAAACGLL